MRLIDVFNVEADENMKDGELLLRFPKGQEHKNVLITNIGPEDEREAIDS